MYRWRRILSTEKISVAVVGALCIMGLMMRSHLCGLSGMPIKRRASHGGGMTSDHSVNRISFVETQPRDGGVEPSSPLPRADVPPSPCGKECDHGSPCILPAGHVPADQHATEHWCVFFDPRRSVSGADAVCTPPVWAEGMTCPYCDGRGYLGCRGDDDCGFCGGTGHVLRDHK